MARWQTSLGAQYYAPGLRKVYFDTLLGIPKEFRQLFNILPPVPSDRSGLHYFDDLQLSSLGGFLPKPEGTSVQYDVPVQGNSVRYQPVTRARGFRITDEAKDDDIYGPISRMAEQLALGAAFQMEVDGHRLINLAFSAVNADGHLAAGFDGQPYASTAHVLLRGGTRANKLTVDEDLSVTALEHALDVFETWVNHSGMPSPKRAHLLVVPPSLKWKAKELTESELKPYTNDNEVNPLGGEGLMYFVDHYLADPDGWSLWSPKMEHDANVWLRREPAFAVGDDFDTGDTKAKGVYRLASGHGEPDGTFFSSGA